MAAPSHNAYTNSASYRRNFDRDLYADSIIVNRGLIHTLKVDHLVTTGPVCFPDGSLAAPSITFCDDLDTGIYSSAPNTVNVVAGGTPAISINVDGDLTMNQALGQLLVSDGTAALPSIAFSADPDTGIYRTAAGRVAISDEGVEVANFFTNGTTADINLGTEALVVDTFVRLGGGAASNDVSLRMTSVNGSVHINAIQTIPPGVALIGSAVTPLITAGSSDVAGNVSIVQGAMGAGGITVTYNNTYGTAPLVVITPTNAAAAALGGSATGVFVTSAATNFSINFTGAGGGASTWAYHVIGLA